MWHHLPMTTLKQANRTVSWTRWLLRVTVTIEAILAIAQPIFIGAFLQGNYSALTWHKTNATLVGAAAFAMTVAAVLHWRPGRGPGWMALACVAVAAAIVVQIVFGYSRTLAIHIPLGVLVVTASALLLVRSWRPARVGIDR
jgi:hypothetical protein